MKSKYIRKNNMNVTPSSSLQLNDLIKKRFYQNPRVDKIKLDSDFFLVSTSEGLDDGIPPTIALNFNLFKFFKLK